MQPIPLQNSPVDSLRTNSEVIPCALRSTKLTSEASHTSYFSQLNPNPSQPSTLNPKLLEVNGSAYQSLGIPPQHGSF